MFTVTRALEEALFQHFIYQKMEIAYAIHKPFPFFESLRDKSFITNRMYKESLEACSNLVPVSRVVHNVLTKLEKTFSLSLLVTLFSEINLHEYPRLKTIFKSFKSGSEPGASSQQSNEIPGEPPSSSDPAVSLPGLIQEGRRTAVTKDNLPKMKEEENSHEMPSAPRHTVQVSSDNLTPQIKDEEDPQEMPWTPSCPTPVIRDKSLEPNDPKEPQEVSIRPSNKKGNKRKRCIWEPRKRRHQKKRLPRGTASPGQDTQEKLQVVDQMAQRKDDSTCNLKVVTTTQKTRTECAQTSRSKEISGGPSEMNTGKKSQETPSTPPRVTQDPMDNGNKLSLGKSSRKKPKCKEGATSPGNDIQEELPVVGQVTQRKTDDSTCNSKMMTRAQRARSKEKPKDDTVDFQCPTLPVTCGKEKGILHVERMKLGPSEKCIQNEEGVWLTAKEFEIKGKGRSTKDWKRSVCCGRKSLREMLKEISRERQIADEFPPPRSPSPCCSRPTSEGSPQTP
ncbi:sp110 nuclear body protein isoform X6 [Lemur catta]|uniref:sp110 nuclear body protein isoform X6 n=1 Tax=Lemur catta TaxID=9447 RepID=UPI001E26E1CF|nr:sp110 nuclear body protein isoform X6 [Lemur catta]